MNKVTPHLLVDLIESFPPNARDAARRDLVGLMTPPFRDLSCRIKCHSLPTPIGLLEYALRYGSPASVELLLEAGADPNDGKPRLMTQLAMAQFCRDEGRIKKLEVMLRAEAETDYVERTERSPPTPLIALARSKLRGIQRYWLGHLLKVSGAPPIATNEYELHVMTRLLAELRAIGGIMECLTPADQEATKATPDSFADLVAAVLRSGDPVALGRVLAARQELKLPIDFDATTALADLAARHAGQPQTPQQAAFARLLLEAGADPSKAAEMGRRAVTPPRESRPVDLPPVEQEPIKAVPVDPAALIAAALHSEDAVALGRLVAAAREGGLPLGFDPTNALIGLATRIADHPMSPKQAAFARVLLSIGAKTQSPAGSGSAFEIALGFENHEFIDILLDAGAKPDLASAPDMVFELMRRQGLPQLPKAQRTPPGPARVVNYN